MRIIYMKNGYSKKAVNFEKVYGVICILSLAINCILLLAVYLK